MSDIGLPSVAGRRQTLFDGRSLAGWPPQHSDSWTTRDGTLVGHGPASTLAFQGPLPTSLASGFMLKLEALTRAGARGFVCFGSAASCDDRRVTIASPASITADPSTWLRTGSIKGKGHVYKNLIFDGTWFTLRVTVAAGRVQVHLNEIPVVDFFELHDKAGETDFIALHWEGGESEIVFRRIELQEVASRARDHVGPSDFDEIDNKIRALTARGIPLLDLHAHLKGGLTIDELLQRSRRHGMQYGVAVNCGKGFPIENDELAAAFCTSMKSKPFFAGMQAEGREWTHMFSYQTASAFDYIFTDSMTWTDNRGQRMRLWIPEEVGSIANTDDFMETLVARTVDILEHEPIDIYVNPTFLPAVIADKHAQLWTEKRMQRVIEAAARNEVAVELNDLYQLPSTQFVRLARAAGCKFTLGSNNTSPADLRRCEYGLQMIEFCGLQTGDFLVPRTIRNKAIERKPQVLHE